jgi:Putative transposase
MIATLHTWSSAMLLHPHLHCIVPSGALLPTKSWENGKGNGDFFVRGHKLAARFKHYFLVGLRELWENEEFDFGIDTETGEVLSHKPNPDLIALAGAEEIRLFFHLLQQKTWNVRIEKPMSGIEQVVNYLGRYVYRIAITNSRIKEIDEKTVRFEYNNYAATPEGEAAKKDEMTLSGLEFLRRFVMHILPLYFQRIRYFGFYAAAAKEPLAEARTAVGNRDWCIPLRTVAQIVATFAKPSDVGE